MDTEIITVNVSGDDPASVNKVLAAIRAMPGYNKDNAKVQEDTRRGGYTTRYATFIIHTCKK